jgi:hypothetical protein
MGTTLTGTTPQDTYDSLIKVTDNGPIGATAKYLSDGLGNDSVLALSTAGLGVGTTTPNIYATSGATNIVSIQASGTNQGGILDIAGTGTGFSGVNIGNNTIRRAFLGSVNGSSFGIYTNNTDTGTVVTERLTITSAGNVGIGTNAPSAKLTISTGAAGVMASFTDAVAQTLSLLTGSGFSAINNPSGGDVAIQTNSIERARFTANGLTFNGDTAAANALDDYEEGTWTPTISFGNASVGVTYTTNSGTYTKIGRQVTAVGYISMSNKGSSTGTARITGLPFTIANAASFYAPPTFGQMNQITSLGQISGYGEIGATTILLLQTTLAGGLTTLANTDFANTSEIMVSFTYFV